MLVLLSLSLSSALADSPPAEVPVLVDGVVITALPAAPLAVLSAGEGTVYVLTAEHELVAWARSDGVWTRRWSRPEPAAAGLFVAGGRAWIERHEVAAAPIEELAVPAAVAGSAPAPSAAPAEAKGGTVIKAERGDVVVDLGRADGLRVGDELRFLRRQDVASFSGEGTSTVERRVGSGTVKAVEPHRALVAVGRGSRVDPGDLAERQPGSDGYPLGPERLGGLVEAGVILRPLLALDTLGVAFVNEAWVGYAFPSPWYVSARFSPVGVGWSQDGNPLTLAAVGTGGLDNRWFSVGLGAGWSMLNNDVSIIGSNDYAMEDGGGGVDLSFEDVKSAFSVAQEARLGARDGLSLSVRNTFVLVPEYTYNYDDCTEYDYDYNDCVQREETGSGFAFGGIAMRLLVPSGERTDLLVDWGTGQAGATWVTGGMATWLRGNGDGGSIGLEVSAGYGSVVGNPEDETVTLQGPLVSAGVRWRGARGR